MKVWMPYVRRGTGTDVFTRSLADALGNLGHKAIAQAFAPRWEFYPSLLRRVAPPPNTDVVLATTWNGFAFKRHGIPLVTVQHLFVLDPAYRPYKSLPQRVYHELFVRRFELASLRASTVQVAVSDYAARAQEATLGGPRPHTILNGIDTDFFTPGQEAAARTGNEVILLFVGNLSRRKGVDLLPEIMTRLGRGFRLEYTAGLSPRSPLVDLTSATPLGTLRPEAIRDAYRRADILLFPTRLEGFGLAAAEALSCGTPVVATNGSSLPEVVDDGVTGRLCAVDDVPEWVKALRGLVAEPRRLAEMGRRAREVTSSRFDLMRMAYAYADIITDIGTKCLRYRSR